MRSNSSGRRIAETSSSRPDARGSAPRPRAAELDVAQRRAQPPQLDRVEAPARFRRAPRPRRRRSTRRGAARSMRRSRSRTGASVPSGRPGPARARRHLAGGELGLEGRDLTRVVRDHGALRPRDAVVHVALAQQARDRVVLLGGRAERERAHRGVRLRLGGAACDARPRRPRRCAASPAGRARSARPCRGARRRARTRRRGRAASRAKFSGVAPRNAPEPTSGSPKAITAMPRRAAGLEQLHAARE